jgi:hypothetical protein
MERYLSVRLISGYRFVRLDKKRMILKSKRLPTLFILILTLNFSHASLLQALPKTQFSIVYSNDVMGEVEPCG